MHEEKIRARHLKYFSQLAEQAEVALRSPEQTTWYTRLYDERDNIRAALEWADKTDTEAGLYLSGNLQSFWESLDLREGIAWLDRFLDKPASKSYAYARAKALNTKAMLLWWVQEANLSHLAAQESLDLYKVHGDGTGEIDALLILAVSGDSIELLQQALELAESLKDPWRQARILGFLAFHGDYPQRISYTQEAVALYKKAGDLGSSIDQMISLAELELQSGNPRSAQGWLDEAVRVSQNSIDVGPKRQVGNFDTLSVLSGRLWNKGWLAYMLLVYGRIALIFGNLEEAYTSLSRSIEIARRLGHRMTHFFASTNLGYLLLQQGNIAEAHNIFMDSAQNFQKDQNPIGVAFSLEGIASIYVIQGKPLPAARLTGWADGARERAKDIRPPIEQADVDKVIDACLVQLSEAAFSEAYDEGKKMSLEEAVAYGLGT